MANKPIATIDTGTNLNYIYGRDEGDIIQVQANQVSVGGLIYPTITTSVTPYDSRCVVAYGGYYIQGNRCFVEVRITSRVTLTNAEYRTMLTGFPQPAVDDFIPLHACPQTDETNQIVNAMINSNGYLFLNSTSGIMNDFNYCISGEYRI